MAIGSTTFPPRQHTNASVRATEGLAHGAMDPVVWPSCDAVALGGGCPCCGRGVVTSATMVGCDFLRDGGGQEEEEAVAATKVPSKFENPRR
jgi:hypothetical protein